MVDPRTLILAIKPAAALLGAALLGWEAWTRKRGPSRGGRTRDVSLAILAVMAFASWWNMGAFHFRGRYLHPHEFFHYYLGAKYFPELGYTRLYECVAAVEVDQVGPPGVARRWMRDLTTNEVRRGARVLAEPAYCKGQFDEARWHSFSHDAMFFRSLVTREKWEELFVDHGYNAAPVWTMMGAVVAGSKPVSIGRLRMLALIDPVLIFCMWAVVWWAFGWRVTAVALLWWGTNIPAGFTFIGGAFLRQDWLLLTVAGVALARRGYSTTAGFALAWAALIRLFPLLVVAGLGGSVLLDLVRRRSWRPQARHGRFAAGFIVACLLLVPLSWMAQGGIANGLSAWSAFGRNTQKHAGGQSPNRMGLGAAMSFSPDARAVAIAHLSVHSPWDVWTSAREENSRARRPIFLALVVFSLVLLARALRGQPDWVALALGTTLIPILLELSNYYYGVLLVLGFLWPANWIAGVGLLVASALTGFAAAIWPMQDDRAFASSLAVLALSWVVLATSAGERRQFLPDDRAESPDSV